MDRSPPGSPVHGILQQEYKSGLPCPLPGDLPDPGIKPTSLTSPALEIESLRLVPSNIKKANSIATNAGKDVGKLEPSYTADGNVKGYSYFGKQS